MRNTRDRPTSDPLEGVRTPRKVVPRFHHYGKLRRECGSPSKIQHCNRGLLTVCRRIHSGAQFTAPIRILYRAKRHSTHLILHTKNMVSVSLKFSREMPCNVEMMLSRTLDYIANQVSSILQGNHPSPVSSGRLQSLVPVVTRNQQIEALPLDPSFGFGAGGPVPGKSSRGFGLVQAIDRQRIVRFCSAKLVTLLAGADVF